MMREPTWQGEPTYDEYEPVNGLEISTKNNR